MRTHSGLPSVVWMCGFLGVVSGVTGCTDLVSPTGRYAMTHPWNVGPPISRGTSQAEVLETWGPPDSVTYLGVDELGIPKEAWLYQARTDLPVDYRYLSKAKRIIFSGEYVTGWEDEAAQDQPTHQ